MVKIAIRSVVLAFSFAVLSPGASAQSYPNRPLKLIVPYGPGAANDTLGRLVADGLAKRMGQPVVVENRPGAGGQIGITHAVKSRADGYTLLLAETGGLTILPALKTPRPYDVINDFTFLGRLAVTPYAMVVRGDMPVNNYKEFVDYAAKNPGAVRHGHTGQGSINHLVAEIVAQQSLIQFTHVPYKGMANVVTDLVAGHIDAALVSPSTIAPYAASGRVKVLVLVSGERHPLLPNVPSYKELGFPEVSGDGWYGVVAPAGLPAEAASKLRSEITSLIADAGFQSQIVEKGFVVAPLDGESFKKFAVEDFKKWQSLGKANRIAID